MKRMIEICHRNMLTETILTLFIAQQKFVTSIVQCRQRHGVVKNGVDLSLPYRRWQRRRRRRRRR